MKLKKSFSFTDRNQIWRLLISDSDKLIVETRDTDKKEVFFNIIDLLTEKRIMNKFQLDEKFWVGIESVYKDIIYFHEFAKPNMPEHKKITALDLNTNKIIWRNDDLSFLSVFEDKVYAFRKKFEGQDLFSLNYFTGEEINNLGDDAELMNQLMQNARIVEDYSNYKYPEKLDKENNIELWKILSNEFCKVLDSENIYVLENKNLLFFNYYIKSKNNLLDNKFAVYNIEKKKKVISDTINRNLNAFSPDSFFLYKNFLFLLRNKVEIVCYKII